MKKMEKKEGAVLIQGMLKRGACALSSFFSLFHLQSSQSCLAAAAVVEDEDDHYGASENEREREREGGNNRFNT